MFPTGGTGNKGDSIVPSVFVHGTSFKSDDYIRWDQEIKSGRMTWKGDRGKLHIYFALLDPLMVTLNRKFCQLARTTTGNRFNHYPFGKKHGPKKGCEEIVQAYNAWRTAALNVPFYITPAHCVLMDDRLTTNLMVQTYDGFTGKFNKCNKDDWSTKEFQDLFGGLCQRQGYRPVVPRLAIQTYPKTYGVLMKDEEPQAAPPPIAIVPERLQNLMVDSGQRLKAPETPETPASEVESESWGQWTVPPKVEEVQTQAMDVDDAAAEPAGGPQGAPPVEEAADVVPNSWQETLHKT